MRGAKLICVFGLIGLVIAGHIGLWQSDRYETDLKWKLTLLNALGWAVIVLPAFGVAAWARAHRSSGERTKPR